MTACADTAGQAEEGDVTAGELTRQTIELLRLSGCTVWRQNAGAVLKGGRRIELAPSGVPDIIGYTSNGTFVALEIKVGKDRLSQAQVDFLRHARQHGCLTGVIRSVEDIERIVELWR